MIRSRVMFFVSFMVLISFYALGQAGPAGDSHVVPAGDDSTTAQANLVSVSIGNASERGAVYLPTVSDRKAWTLEYKVEAVRDMWLKADTRNAANVEAVRKSALESADSLEKIPDADLGLGGLLIKNEYACFGYVIAGANTKSKSLRLSLAQKADTHCKAAKTDLAIADKATSTESNAFAVKEWELRGDEHPRIAYLHAMSKCLEVTSSRNAGHLKEEVETILSSEIVGSYLNRYPPKNDYVLRMCVGP